MPWFHGFTVHLIQVRCLDMLYHIQQQNLFSKGYLEDLGVLNWFWNIEDIANELQYSGTWFSFNRCRCHLGAFYDTFFQHILLQEFSKFVLANLLTWKNYYCLNLHRTGWCKTKLVVLSFWFHTNTSKQKVGIKIHGSPRVQSFACSEAEECIHFTFKDLQCKWLGVRKNRFYKEIYSLSFCFLFVSIHLYSFFVQSPQVQCQPIHWVWIIERVLGGKEFFWGGAAR